MKQFTRPMNYAYITRRVWRDGYEYLMDIQRDGDKVEYLQGYDTKFADLLYMMGMHEVELIVDSKIFTLKDCIDFAATMIQHVAAKQIKKRGRKFIFRISIIDGMSCELLRRSGEIIDGKELLEY